MRVEEIETGATYRSYPVGRYSASDREVVRIEPASYGGKVWYRVHRSGNVSCREYSMPLDRFARSSRCIKAMSQSDTRETFETARPE